MNKTFKNKAGNLILELRHDSRSAWLTIKNTGKLVDETEILALIDDAGIKYGFDEASRLIREQSLEKEFDIPFPLAISSLTESTGTLRYNFNPDVTINFSEGISFDSLEKLRLFNSGDTVALYTDNIFEQGGSIYDIFGELINNSTVDTDKALALTGDGVHYDPSGREFIASKNGYPYLDSTGRICILDLIALKSDQIPSDRKITIPIDALVKGSIAFANLACNGSLTIQGDLHNCQILCNGTLVVDGEMVSCNSIHAYQDIHCKSISDSYILSNGQVRFSGTISNTILSCSMELLGDASSWIKGGVIQTGGSISIAKAGSPDGAKTEIEIAISPYNRSLLMNMTKELVRLKEDSETNALAIAELQTRIKTCENALDDQLNAFLKRPLEDKKSIIIDNEVLPPVLFRVLKHSYYIKSPEKHMEFIEKE